MSGSLPPHFRVLTHHLFTLTQHSQFYNTSHTHIPERSLLFSTLNRLLLIIQLPLPIHHFNLFQVSQTKHQPRIKLDLKYSNSSSKNFPTIGLEDFYICEDIYICKGCGATMAVIQQCLFAKSPSDALNKCPDYMPASEPPPEPYRFRMGDFDFKCSRIRTVPADVSELKSDS